MRGEFIQFVENNHLIDYGCGKGRVSLFLAYQVKCNSIGIEYDKRLYDKAVGNRENGISGARVQFECIDAKEYQLVPQTDRIFFFNPFCEEILKAVLNRIYESYYDNPRQILLMFYYPSDEYIACLMQEAELSFYDEIDCMDIFGGHDTRERIMIFSIG